MKALTFLKEKLKDFYSNEENEFGNPTVETYAKWIEEYSNIDKSNIKDESIFEYIVFWDEEHEHDVYQLKMDNKIVYTVIFEENEDKVKDKICEFILEEYNLKITKDEIRFEME